MQTTLPANDRVFDAKAYRQPLSEWWKALPVEELVQKCQTGERAAFEELIRRYKQSIFHCAYRLTDNRDTAEDLAAETYLRIFQRIGTFKAARALPAWINRIVRNAWLDTVRHSQRHPATSLDALEATGVNRGLTALEVQSGRAPQQQAEENERHGIIGQAIATLPNFQRRIVNLYYMEEWSYQEIAETMRLPIGTVKSRLNRARNLLRVQLTPQITAWID